MTSRWSEGFLGVADRHGHEGNDKARKGGTRPAGLARRSDVSSGRRWTAHPGPVEKKGTSRHRSEGFFPPPQLRDLSVWSSDGLTVDCYRVVHRQPVTLSIGRFERMVALRLVLTLSCGHRGQ